MANLPALSWKCEKHTRPTGSEKERERDKEWTLLSKNLQMGMVLPWNHSLQPHEEAVVGHGTSPEVQACLQWFLTGHSHFKSTYRSSRVSSINLQLTSQSGLASYKSNRSLLSFYPQRCSVPCLSRASGGHRCLQHPGLPMVGQEEGRLFLHMHSIPYRPYQPVPSARCESGAWKQG